MRSSSKGFTIYRLVLLLTLFFLPLALSRPAVLAADHFLQELDIEVLIQDDGSALISERRRAVLSKDTELFIVIGNLGQSTIRNFQVEENGQLYSYQDNWDIKASRAEKAFKHGIVKQADHYELCWGIGEYGSHTYKVTYTITDFIKQLDDAQIIFWRFVNDQTNLPPRQVRIRIAAANQALPASADEIWAFGFTGTIAYADGAIIVSSETALATDDYVTILAKLPQASFASNDKLNLSFSQIKSEALKGSSYGSKLKKFFGSGANLATLALVLLLFTLPGLAAAKLAAQSLRRRKLRRQYAGHYWRDLPFTGDLEQIYALLKHDHQASFERLLSTILLKWLQSGSISFTADNKTRLFGQDKSSFRLRADFLPATPLEHKLYAVFQEACGPGFETTQQQLTKLMRQKSSQIQRWAQETEVASRQFLFESGYSQDPGKKLQLTLQGDELNGRLFMFANYLRDFPKLIDQPEYANSILDQMMLWAVIFGFAESFSLHYKTLFPSYYANSYYTTESLARVRTISSSIASSGGSSSSSGGGGGSFGGGSGGGSR